MLCGRKVSAPALGALWGKVDGLTTALGRTQTWPAARIDGRHPALDLVLAGGQTGTSRDWAATTPAVQRLQPPSIAASPLKPLPVIWPMRRLWSISTQPATDSRPAAAHPVGRGDRNEAALYLFPSLHVGAASDALMLRKRPIGALVDRRCRRHRKDSPYYSRERPARAATVWNPPSPSGPPVLDVFLRCCRVGCCRAVPVDKLSPLRCRDIAILPSAVAQAARRVRSSNTEGIRLT